MTRFLQSSRERERIPARPHRAYPARIATLVRAPFALRKGRRNLGAVPRATTRVAPTTYRLAGRRGERIRSR